MEMMLCCGTYGDHGRPDGEICLVSGGQRSKRVVQYGFVITTRTAFGGQGILMLVWTRMAPAESSKVLRYGEENGSEKT
jgi:hypothetical protein